MPQGDFIEQSKRDLRKQLRKRRSDQSEKETVSRQLFERLQNAVEYRIADTILFYVDVRDEVRTQTAIYTALVNSRRVVVPFCDDGRLQLVELQSLDELTAGAYDILEPNDSLKKNADRRVTPSQVDLALIPGLGFDRHGGRIGHGKGYYDRLIPELTENCCRIGIAFDCQIVENVPTSVHDQFMNLVVTESEVINCVQG